MIKFSVIKFFLLNCRSRSVFRNCIFVLLLLLCRDSSFYVIKFSVESSELFNSIAVAEEFRFRPMPLSYMVPSLASFFEVSEILCLSNCDRRRLNATVDFLCLSIELFFSFLRIMV